MPRFTSRSSSNASTRPPSHPLTRSLLLALAVLLVVAVAALVWALAGYVDVAADGSRNGLLERFLEAVRQRSVARQTDGLEVPELSDPARRLRGERLYRHHCALCHGRAGEPRGAVADGLHPTPPDLSHGIPARDAAKAWWITSHGIRMTGMPAFREHLSEEEVWDVVAWLTGAPAEPLPQEGVRESPREVPRRVPQEAPKKEETAIP